MANGHALVEIVPGIVFRPNTGQGRLTHPYVVVAVSDGRAFTVNWTDFLNYEESSCVLEVGEHPQITKRSAMAYPRFKEFPIEALSRELSKGEQLLRLDDLKPEVLERVEAGAKASLDLTNLIKIRYGLL